jgi:hypothetical protein
MTPDDDTREREAEILVLRHQLAVKKRANPRPRIRRLDRMIIAAFARLIRRDRWSGFIVSPATILRWHRELVARKWTLKGTETNDQRLSQRVRRIGLHSRGRFGPCSSRSRTCCCTDWSNLSLASPII